MKSGQTGNNNNVNLFLERVDEELRYRERSYTGLYKCFCKEIEVKNYSQWIQEHDCCLCLGLVLMHGLNEDLGRHGGKNDWQCKLCGDECESVVHVLWECPVYATIRNTFMGELDSCGAVLKCLMHSIIKIINWLYLRV